MEIEISSLRYNVKLINQSCHETTEFSWKEQWFSGSSANVPYVTVQLGKGKVEIHEL